MDTLRLIGIAELLGITKQRGLQIVNADESFPVPVDTDPRRWDRSAVEQWAETRFFGNRPWRVKPS